MSESNAKDDGMSPDERIAWLRERVSLEYLILWGNNKNAIRLSHMFFIVLYWSHSCARVTQGVLVETPEERRSKAVSKIMEEPDETDEAITYILVPHDASKPLQELSFPVGKISGDALAEHLRPAFGGNSQSIDLNLFKKQAATQLAATDATVSEAALQQVAEEGNVETFTLVHPSPANHFTGINVYLDEVGMLKRLRLNKRASDYALRAGFNPPPHFYGDVFMGRFKVSWVFCVVII
jgi:AraC-like DNA-binding protein